MLTAANAQNVIAGLDQGGLGLPDRDYYLKDEKMITMAAMSHT